MLGKADRPDASSSKMARFRHRPHANPLADNDFQFPCTEPDEFPFDLYYPTWTSQRSTDAREYHFDIVDIGCGYGDFVRNVSLAFPDLLVIGLELRDIPVVLGQQALLNGRSAGQNENAAIIRCNIMKHLPRLLARQSVRYLTVMFPDPQFKASHARRRVISPQLLSEYAYYLKSGGFLFVCSDLQDLYLYMCSTIAGHPFFCELQHEEGADDNDGDTRVVKTILKLMDKTADAERHMRKDADKTVYKAVFRCTKPHCM
ncbi:putative tRNA methyltransferase subunit [Giardia duodenalis]|uniref:tRNA (guanine-N(7)-)-methyltransferase n=1 Tax=Giardia intestinalis (strain ATCC 50803 / WB clone C6) TaxID=184922 RepID=A8B2F8_GIAIC|nr:putative tRNA methyltransferase subunit [Giardia intestinalis]KAE8302970.1 putative tRNA methyltransferase subunit [Giardia intestinalis]|eukprot:XP_001709962.1 tRNA methyltransferase subunit, putative [Giardia lamblia ATCC 50803]